MSSLEGTAEIVSIPFIPGSNCVCKSRIVKIPCSPSTFHVKHGREDTQFRPLKRGNPKVPLSPRAQIVQRGIDTLSPASLGP